jgi:hypothetical protein
MIFADNDLVVVQEMLTGGYSVTVPSPKADDLSDRLDDADIFYEMDYDYADVDDTTEAESTATVFTFGADVDVRHVQTILDSME